MANIKWIAQFGCEGGPAIVGDARTMAHWPGGRPLPLDQRQALHIWGQFTDELPKRFHPNGPGGHQYVQGDLQALWSDLTNTIKEQWPKATLDTDEDLMRTVVSRRDHKRGTFELSPISEYMRAVEQGSGSGFLHRWGQHKALFWRPEGPGTVDVGQVGDDIVLLRTWENDGAGVSAARGAIAAAATKEHLGELDVVDNRLVLAWAHVDMQSFDESSYAPGSRLDNEWINGIGTVVAVKPGTYAIDAGACDDGDDDQWAARFCWLRLQ